MSGNGTARSSLVTAAEWFAGGQRIPYDSESGRVVTAGAAAMPGGLRASMIPARALPLDGISPPPEPQTAGRW
jgi:hypothetical protein